MYRRNDPRFRRTLNEISQTIELANESAQANVYSFSHKYLSPCVSSVTSCLNSCTSPCFPVRDQRRRSRARSRGRAELSFDFYDDWENDDEDASLLGWGNDESDGLLGVPRAYGAIATQPGRQRAMSYGARRSNQRRSQVREVDDPNVIPASSYWGFLGNWTGKIGRGKSLRYKPSAADLQEHPGAQRNMPEEASLLDEDDDANSRLRGHRRVRSGTQGSGNTTDSLSSRGDIFPSEDELDDAVPLDDEFAMVLERRTTNSVGDEASSGRKGKRPSAGSRLSTRTASSRSSRNSKRFSQGYSSDSSAARELHADEEPKTIPSMAQLRQEEERISKEEEAGISQRREAAQRLATEYKLDSTLTAATVSETRPGPDFEADNTQFLTTEKRLPPAPGSQVDLDPEGAPTSEPTTPFPAFDPPLVEDVIPASVIPASLHNVEQGFNPARLPRL